MPVSTFRGAPRAERTTHHHDKTGRLVSSVTVHEAEWTDVDRALALALQMLEKGICPCGCGQPIEIAWDPMQDGRFVVNEDTQCYARTALEDWRKNEGQHANPGVLPFVEHHPDPTDNPTATT